MTILKRGQTIQQLPWAAFGGLMGAISTRRGYAKFALQFPSSQLLSLADRYGHEQDDAAFAAGRNIVRGDYSIRNLRIIIEWKSARIAGLIEKNSANDVANALRFATDVRTSEKSAVDTLRRLRGVGIPVASSILTMVNPNKYTIIDFRALEALGVKNGQAEETVEYYLEYLQICRKLAREHNTDLRTLDRALWQWSKENSSFKGCS